MGLGRSLSNLLLTTAFFCTAVCAEAQSGSTSENEKTSGSRPLAWVKSLMHRLDSSAVTKVDARYIEVPQRAWRVILRPKMSDIDVVSDNENILSAMESIHIKMDLNTRPMASLGVWVGYRGLGFSYAYKLQKNGGTNFSLSSTGAKFGLNMRLHDLSTDRAHLLFEGMSEGKSIKGMDEDVRFTKAIKVSTFYLNGYYVFNGRRYSQAAAYNQSVIQRRSAGSFLLGATVFTSMVEMAEKENAFILEMGKCPGRFSLGQINVGLGYGYNWVPARGWVVNAMVMPTISVYDRIKRTHFTSNYTVLTDPTTLPHVGDYGTWDPEKRQWANGEKQQPVLVEGNGENEWEVKEWKEDVDLWETHTDSHASAFKLNVDARLGVAYCWNRFFVSANGQFNRFSYGQENNKVTNVDWYVNTSFGIRL